MFCLCKSTTGSHSMCVAGTSYVSLWGGRARSKWNTLQILEIKPWWKNIGTAWIWALIDVKGVFSSGLNSHHTILLWFWRLVSLSLSLLGLQQSSMSGYWHYITTNRLMQHQCVCLLHVCEGLCRWSQPGLQFTDLCLCVYVWWPFLTQSCTHIEQQWLSLAPGSLWTWLYNDAAAGDEAFTVHRASCRRHAVPTCWWWRLSTGCRRPFPWVLLLWSQPSSTHCLGYWSRVRWACPVCVFCLCFGCQKLKQCSNFIWLLRNMVSINRSFYWNI